MSSLILGKNVSCPAGSTDLHFQASWCPLSGAAATCVAYKASLWYLGEKWHGLWFQGEGRTPNRFDYAWAKCV